MVDTTINGRWTLKLPEHRAERPEWPWWEATRLACMHHYLGAGGHVVYDIGAEEGDFPALWSSWDNQVALFEPNAKVWPNLLAIWEANRLPDPVLCFAGFAGNESQDGLLLSPEWPESTSGPVISDHGFCNLSERPDIPRLRLDDLHHLSAKQGRSVSPPTAITVDVEGSELRVLWGAQKILSEARPLVWVSVHRDFMRDMYGDTPEDLDMYMASLNYEKMTLCTDHEQHVFYWPRERELFVQ